MKILLITQDENLSDVLTHDFFAFVDLDLVKSKKKAISSFFENSYDLIILDSPFQYTNSLDILREIREENNLIPIIFLLFRGNEDLLIKVLELGVDDVLCKPFYSSALKSKINKVFKKIFQIANNENSCLKNLSFSFQENNFYISQKLLKLPRKEYFLLRYLLFNKNKVLSKDELYEKIWQVDNFANSNTVDVHISRLRKKLEQSNAKVKIENYYGFGYALKSL